MRKNKESSKLQEKKDFDDKISKGIDILNNYKESIKKEREERIGKTFEDENIEYKEEQNKYEKVRPLILSLIIILIIVFVYIFFSFGPILGISLNKEKGISEEDRIDIVTTDEDIYLRYNLDLLVYSNKVITTYNSNGNKNWQYKLTEQFTPNIYVKEKYMVVSNNSNGTIYLFENKQEILNKQIEGTIENIYLDEHGNMAIEYSTTGYKKIIGVYSKKGKNLYNAYISSEGIIDIKLLENAGKLLLVQANSNTFQIGVTVSIIDGKSLESSIKEIAKLDDNFVYDLTIQGQNIIMLLDDSVVKINIESGSMTYIRKFDSSQLMFITLSSNYFTHIEKELDKSENEYLVQTSKLDNTQIGSLKIKNSPKIMKNGGLLNYFIYQDSLQVINKWGIEVKNISIGFPPKDVVIFNNEKNAAMIYTNKIYIITI